MLIDISRRVEERITRILDKRQAKEQETNMDLFRHMTQVMANVIQTIFMLDHDWKVHNFGQAGKPIPTTTYQMKIKIASPHQECKNCSIGI